MTDLEPSFSEPWHAQVFAMTVHLNETGRLHWPDWTAAFSKTLKKNGLSHQLDGGDDYFLAWLETLEGMLNKTGAAARNDVNRVKLDWEVAYRDTPHGRPVRLKD